MKLRITHPRSQVVLTSIALIAISIACSASKSADSPSANAANASTSQPLTSPSNATVQDKQPCALTLSAAPNINGLTLGMTTEEVLAVFPGSKADPEVSSRVSNINPFGAASFAVKPEKYGAKEKFAGIDQINFSVLDGRIFKLYAGYNSRDWPHVDKFITHFVAGTNLPAADQWEAYVGMDNQLKTLKCPDFEARVFAGGKGVQIDYVELLDLVADKTLKDRRKKAREQASPTPGN